MNIKKINQLIILLILSGLLIGCANMPNTIKHKKFKHNTPLIKGDIKSQGKAEIAKTVEMGPKPVDGDTEKLQKRKKISSEIKTNYSSISKKYPLLKQQVTFKYKNIEFKEAMELMGKIGVQIRDWFEAVKFPKELELTVKFPKELENLGLLVSPNLTIYIPCNLNKDIEIHGPDFSKITFNIIYIQ